MCEQMQKQNAEVLEHLQRKREFSEKEMHEISRTISKAHKAVIDRVDNFISQEYDRVEQEIAQLEQQLLEKLAERRELRAWFRHIGFQTGLQSHVELDLEGKEGE